MTPTDVTITLQEDDAQWLLAMLEDEYPLDEEIRESYPEACQRIERIMKVLDERIASNPTHPTTHHQ